MKLILLSLVAFGLCAQSKLLSQFGYDFVLTSDSGCTTLLAWDQQELVVASGKVARHVRIPTASTGVDTTIYACYGNAAIVADQQNKSGSYDANYLAVYNFGTPSSLVITDATSNAANLSNSGSVAAGTGPWSGAASFNGSSALYKLTAMTNSIQPITVEVWSKPVSTASQAIWCNGQSGTTGYCGYIFGGFYQFLAASQYFNPTSTVPSTSSFDYYVIRSVPANYGIQTINGAGGSSGSGIPPLVPAAIFTIGSSSTSLAPAFNDQFTGLIAQLRFSSAARGDDYISATYNSYNAPGSFYLVGSEGAGANGYNFKRSIVIDHTKVPNTDQTDFPMLFTGTYSWLTFSGGIPPLNNPVVLQ